MASKIDKSAHPFDKTRFDSLLNRRFFYAPAFEIYGGIAGLYDYGPAGSSLQANIIAEWRKHFIVAESMLELDTTIMTPAPVFETSGHVARFADWMVKDLKTGEVLRADHLVKGVLEVRLAGDQEARGVTAVPKADDGKKKRKKDVKPTAVKLDDGVVTQYETLLAQLDNYDGPALGQLMKEHKITNPDTGNEVSDPQPFNLMFASSIGPTGQHPGYLRPETAQGHFLNFNRLLDYNNKKVPFASAQIGRSFRNEISPRAGLLRVREFTMAEIEHFVDPLNKSHSRFHEVVSDEIDLLPRDVQSAGSTKTVRMKVGDAVIQGIIANETLGYFIARIQQFLLHIGVNSQHLRFRQHMANEMAHYATDCWDAEIRSSFGWIECVGCADRAAYDLSVHSKRTGIPLVVREELKDPIIEEKEMPEWEMKLVGKTFRKEAAMLTKHVEDLDEAQLLKLKGELAQGETAVRTAGGQEFTVTPEMLKIEKKVLKTSVREYTPNVIEPSFGLGRILYSLLEHSYWSRADDVERGVLSLPPVVAPTKVLICPISAKSEFDPLVQDISLKLRRAGVFSRVDDSSVSIGRRYARNDELGTPFGVTVDFASLTKGTVTLRERDTTDQIIGPLDDVIALVAELCEGTITWDEACHRLPKYSGVQDVE